MSLAHFQKISHQLDPEVTQLFALLTEVLEARLLASATDLCEGGTGTPAALEHVLRRFPSQARVTLSGGGSAPETLDLLGDVAERTDLNDLLAPAAWLGARLSDLYPGLRWRMTPSGQLLLTGAEAAPNAIIFVGRLLADVRHGVEEVSLVEELARVSDGLQLAAALNLDHDSAVAAEEFFSQYPAGVVGLPREEIEPWVAPQAEAGRRAAALLADRDLAASRAGIEACRRFATRFRYIQPFSEAMAARIVFFAHECVRRVADAEYPGTRTHWQQGGTTRDPLQFVVEATNVPAGAEEAAQRLVRNVRAALSGLLPPTHHPERAAAPSLLDEYLNFLESAPKPDRTDAPESEEETPRMPSRHAARAVVGTPESEAPTPRESVKPAGPEVPRDRPIALFDNISVNREILDIRQQMVQRYSGDAPDLFLPCKRDLTQGARLLNVTPATGIFFESEDELITQLREVYPRILEQVPNRVAPDYTLFFSFIEGSMSDLLVVIRKPLLFGANLRTDFLVWELGDDIPGKPLSPEARKSGELYDPIQRRIREALFHLQYTGDATTARALLEEALEEDPNRQSALLAMSQFHLAIGNQITARGYVQALLQVDPKNVEARMLDARFMLDEDRILDALKAARGIVTDHPDHVEALVILARCQAIDGQLREAAESIERALLLEPSNPEASMLKSTLEGMERALP